MPTLVLSKISFEGRHGATAIERESLRRFEVDIEVDAPLEVAQSTDRLVDTIDYQQVAEIIVAIGTRQTNHLLEALARHMIDALAKRFPEATFRIEVRKLNPPECPGQPVYAAVRMGR
ncbi:MAG TPA: dihydroneopterin aldolase [Polyangia bacterium]